MISFLRNPLGDRIRRDLTERRIDAFAAAGLGEERIRRWAVIRAAWLQHDGEEVAVFRALL